MGPLYNGNKLVQQFPFAHWEGIGGVLIVECLSHRCVAHLLAQRPATARFYLSPAVPGHVNILMSARFRTAEATVMPLFSRVPVSIIAFLR